MMIPAFVFFIVFSYIPMAGAYFAFTKYEFRLGYFRSPFIGLGNFAYLFKSGILSQLTIKTLLYNLAFILFGNVAQILCALFLNDLGSKRFVRVSQTIIFLPYFISMVLVGVFAYNLLNIDNGFINSVLSHFGMKKFNFYMTPGAWPFIIVAFHVWKGLGYGTVIYLSTLTGLDPELYEAARIDGANKWQQIAYITIPLLKPTAVLLMLFSLMTIVAGFRRMGALDAVSRKLTRRVTTLRGLSAVMVALCFALSMLVTNDVALLTLVPLTLLLFRAGGQKSTIWTVVLETVAANLGSMVTPIGNPQNLYLYTSGRLTALDFLTLLAPYAAVALALLLALCLLLPKERVAVDASVRAPLARKMLTLYGALSALALLAIAKVLPAWALAAAVLLGTLALDRGTIRQVDYTLLATFVCFFVFVASVKACVPVRAWLETMMARSPMAVALLTSQVISNVPACLLLSPFTQDAKALALGVDLGGLGTLIASLASLISFRLYGAGEGAQKGRYFAVFTGVNVLFLAVMLGLAAIL